MQHHVTVLWKKLQTPACICWRKYQSCFRKHKRKVNSNKSQFPVCNAVCTTFRTDYKSSSFHSCKKWIIPVRWLRKEFLTSRLHNRNLIREKKRLSNFPCEIGPCLFEITKVRLTYWRCCLKCWLLQRQRWVPRGLRHDQQGKQALFSIFQVLNHEKMPQSVLRACNLYSQEQSGFIKIAHKHITAAIKPRSNFRAMTYRNWRRVQWWMIVNLGIF